MQIAGTQYASALDVLRLFAYGTLKDYKSKLVTCGFAILRFLCPLHSLGGSIWLIELRICFKTLDGGHWVGDRAIFDEIIYNHIQYFRGPQCCWRLKSKIDFLVNQMRTCHLATLANRAWAAGINFFFYQLLSLLMNVYLTVHKVGKGCAYGLI